MNEKELIRKIIGDNARILFWTAFERALPHLFLTLSEHKKGKRLIKGSIRKDIWTYLSDREFINELPQIKKGGSKIREFSNSKYGITGETKTKLYFFDSDLAKEFFIEASFLNPDGTELIHD